MNFFQWLETNTLKYYKLKLIYFVIKGQEIGSEKHSRLFKLIKVKVWQLQYQLYLDSY